MPNGFDTVAPALDWLRSERANLVAAVVRAAGIPAHREHAIDIALGLAQFLDRERHLQDWAVTATAAVNAAAGLSDHHRYPTQFDLAVYFLHDVAPEIAAAGEPYQRPEADAVFGSVCDFDAWPSVPIGVVAGAGDRFFPVEFQQALARDRLGVEADVLPGGHLIALAQPSVLVNYLLA